jgi:3',5'-cyclic AMP phosphodiesterase CpdA
MRFVHCSDVHITEDYFALPLHRLGWRRWVALAELTVGGRAKRYVRAPQVLSAIVRDAQSHGADHFILSGDVTACALEGEFAGARKALGPLAEDRRRCTIVPGNHDVYTPGSIRSGRFARHFGQLLESDMPEYRREGAYPFVRLVGEEAAVVGLLSTRAPPKPAFPYGLLGEAQLEGLATLLRDSRLDGRAVLVTVHHAPRNRQGRPDRWNHGLRDADALLRLLPGPRFAVLHGHIHERYHHPATADKPHLFGAGSSTEAGHEGYWLIEVAHGQVVGGSLHTPSL